MRVKMIDFAHASLYPEEIEKGYLKGLETLIKAVDAAAEALACGEETPGGIRELLACWAAKGDKKETEGTCGDT